MHAAHALHDIHVGETVVHHISEEDDCVRAPAFRDAPRLAQIHVDEDPGHGPKERAAPWVRPPIENLWIGDEEDVSRLSISLLMVVRSRSETSAGKTRRGAYIWPTAARTCRDEDADFQPQDDRNPGDSYGSQ